MSRTPIALIRIVPVLLIASVLALALSQAADIPARFTVGSVVIERPWSRATPGGASVGVGYFTVTNTGTVPDVLLGGTASFADRIEVHEMSETDGVMRMRALADGLVIPPSQTVKLEPSGTHVMFTGLKHALKAGEAFKATLDFKTAGKVEVEFAVAPIGAREPGDGD